MSQKLVAPSPLVPGSPVLLSDGSEIVVDSDGTATVPDGEVIWLLNNGWEYAASDAGQQSSALSSVATVVAATSSVGSKTTASVATVSSAASVLAVSEAVSSSTASRVKSSFGW
jgi:hypothetical protein